MVSVLTLYTLYTCQTTYEYSNLIYKNFQYVTIIVKKYIIVKMFRHINNCNYIVSDLQNYTKLITVSIFVLDVLFLVEMIDLI